MSNLALFVAIYFALQFIPHEIAANSQFVSQRVTGFGPHVKQTWGEPWPKPQRTLTYGDNFMVVRTSLFRFHVTNLTCDMVELALKRYYAIFLEQTSQVKGGMGNQANNVTGPGYRGHLDVLEVSLLSPCEYLPHDKMDESYKIKIDTPNRPGRGVLVANTNWGILRGLETFSQIVHHSPNHSALRVKSTFIQDYPRFSFRSVLLDTSRHFLDKSILLQNLDLMAMNKMNVFHWHLVDDQSFPFQSKKFPELSAKGAYHPYTHVYTSKDVSEVIEYARLRGIRVIPEFDTPGHTQSWGPAVPGLLTECYSGSPPTRDGTFGPIDPTNSENYGFIQQLFSEIATTFPDKYLHLGGDEVDFSCWASNPDIAEFMRGANMTEYSSLEQYYMQKLVSIVASFPENKSSIVWQEVVDNGVQMSRNTTLVNVWKGGSYQEELANVTEMGYRAVLYSCWYLDMISWNPDWPRYYSCDPQNFTGSRQQHQRVVGGGAALWGEFVDYTNILPRLWPRASAPAEVLWGSSVNVGNVEEAAPRLEEHRCRLLQRGYPVQPINGPGFCEGGWKG